MTRTICCAAALLLTLGGCKREDMYTQNELRSWDRSTFLPQQSAMQHPVAGTVARDDPDAPVPPPPVITAALLIRGQQRYDIFCTPCHGASGDGGGRIVERGFPRPPTLYDDRLRHARARLFYDVITYGHGVMYSYADRVPPADRWAIAAYIRALQFGQDAQVAGLTPEDRARLQDCREPRPWVIDTLYGYLPVWLFFAAIPLGALPMVMAMEVLGAGERPLATALRRVLVALPVSALLAIPLLLHVPLLYHWGGLAGFAARWFRPRAFAIREAAFLVIWSLLALLFLPAPGGGGAKWRRALGVPGLVLHLAMGTVAAIDWTLSLQPGLGSSSFGLLVMVGQCGAAVSAAILLAALLGEAAAVTAGARPMLALFGAWIFLHFTQYLVVWSANLPGEIVWYQQRQSGLGLAVVVGACACGAVALLLLPRRFAGQTEVVAAIAALLLLLHLAEALWLITPAWRGRLVITGPDLPPMLGLVGLLALWALAVRRMGRRHARR